MLLPIVLLHGKERNPLGQIDQFKRWSKSVGKKCLEFLRLLLKACPKILMMILIFATTSCKFWSTAILLKQNEVKMGTYLSLRGRGKGEGANSRLGAYSNKHAILALFWHSQHFPANARPIAMRMLKLSAIIKFSGLFFCHDGGCMVVSIRLYINHWKEKISA